MATLDDVEALGDAATATIGALTQAQVWKIAIAGFRSAFPLFASTNVYPDAQVQAYMTFAQAMLRPERWGEVLQMGIYLFTAHMLALDRIGAGGTNGIPGTVVGLITSGSVDKVSYSRDVSSVMEDGAGHWGSTTYGLRFLRLARMMGTGPIQVGAPNFWGAYGPGGVFTNDPAAYLPQSALAYNGAWPGPWSGPW